MQQLRKNAVVAVVIAGTGAVALLASPAQAVHEMLEVTGLTQSGRLVTFLAGAPEHVSDPVKLSGLASEERLVGIDYRPATHALYGLARDDATGAGRLYRIDPATGVATAIGGGGFALVGKSFGVDFNPVVDRVRVVSDAGQNIRLHPDTGALVATDGSLSYSDGAGSASGAAYTNNDRNPATGTALYDIDAERDVLALQSPPNAGTLSVVGSGLGVDTNARVGFDVYTEGATNVALAVLGSPGRSTLYVIRLATGDVNPASAREIGSKPFIVDIAIPTDQ